MKQLLDKLLHSFLLLNHSLLNFSSDYSPTTAILIVLLTPFLPFSTLGEGIPAVNTTTSPGSTYFFTSASSIAPVVISSVVSNSKDFNGSTPQEIAILRIVRSFGVTPKILCLGRRLETTLVVAPETDGVMMHYAFRFDAASTEEYPIAPAIPVFK